MESNTTTTEVTRPPECGAFEDVSAFRFWFDGVLVSVIAVVGFAGNLLALVVLSRDLGPSRGQSNMSVWFLTNELHRCHLRIQRS